MTVLVADQLLNYRGPQSSILGPLLSNINVIDIFY